MTNRKQTTYIEKIKELYIKEFGKEPSKISIIPPSGSDRKYIRLFDENERTVIGVFNPDRNENVTFLYFTNLFHKHQLPVAQVITNNSRKETYLVEDLGTQSLFDILIHEGKTERVKNLFKKAIDQLVKFHWDAGSAVDYTICYGAQGFDQKQIFSDLLYFKYYFADLLKVNYNKQEFLEEIEEWSKSLAASNPLTFMYRDFQSRNIMVKDEQVFFIDYQGGMLGLPQYDMASLLWQAKAKLPNDWKEELLNYYFDALKHINSRPNFDELAFRRVYIECILLRILQTLGAYGFRGLIEKKPHFISSIQPALEQLKDFLDTYSHFPNHNELRKLLEEITKDEIIASFCSGNTEGDERLRINVYSFSYKQGIPMDSSGNGGGYVFDCRGIANPGREEAYKSLTGKDKNVREYLEQHTEMPQFMQHVKDTVNISVEDYVARKFSHLSVAFGCTGGQHRSVYAAEVLAKYLSENSNVNVVVTHLEQEPNNVLRR